MSTTPPSAASKDLRNALGAFATGVAIVTAMDRSGKPHGLTVNSFSSVSLEPPMVLWSQSIHAPSHPIFYEAPGFAVNILAEDQVHLSAQFSRSGVDKFADTVIRPGLDGLPLIEGCAASFECVTQYRYPGGDHVIFVGLVKNFTRHEHRPLVFGGGRYLIAQPHDLGGSPREPAAAALGDISAVRMATPIAADLAAEIGESVCIAVWGNQGPTVVRWEESRNPVSLRLQTGLVLPILTSATGLLFAAYLPDLADPAGQLPPERLSDLRKCGLCTLRSTEFSGMYGGDVDAISAPVLTAAGDIALAMTVVRRADEVDRPWDREAVIARLQRATTGLSTRLGHRSRQISLDQ